jgi:hypothetical protein
MQRIYRALGIASAQDVRDLQESTASLHQKTTDLATTAAVLATQILTVGDKLDELVAAQRKSMDDLVQEVRDNIDIDVLADDVASAARDNFDISDCIDVYDLAREVRDNIDVDALAQEVSDTVDLDDLADKVRDNLDLDNLVDIETLTNQVTNAMRTDESNNLDKMVNQVIEREAPGIIGAHLKHLDWDDELSVDVEIDGAIIATVRSNR